MKKLISALALGCTAVLAFSAAACGGGDNRENVSTDTLTGTYGFQWTDVNAPILNETGAAELPAFHIYSSKNESAKDYNDMEIMQTLFEQTNVPVEWENVSESVYGEQKTLKLGNHTGIDAIYHAGMTPSDIINFGTRRGQLLAINEYLQYMPTFSKILEERPDIKKSITSADGNIYALPRIEEMGLLQNPNLLFLNKNWTVAAIQGGADIGIAEADVKDGLKLTAAQMEKLLQYFKDNDMNGKDGNTDERPLSFCYGNWQGNQCDLYGMFGINDNTDHRIIKDGKVTYTVLDEAYYEATNFIHDWISRGLIDEVSLEQKQNEFLANGKNNIYGAFYWWESETVVSDPENYICCQPLVGRNGAQTVSVANSPEVSQGELIIFKSCPNVEVLLAYFDRYYLPEISAQINYGPIGIAFNEEKDANGKLVAKDPPAGKTTDEIRLENAPLGICYLSDDAWENVVNMEPRAQLRLERLNKYATPFYDHTKIQPLPNLQFTSQEIGVLTSKESTLVNRMREKLMEFLRNGVNESAWKSFTDELQGRGVGLPDVQKVYQDAYDRFVSGN